MSEKQITHATEQPWEQNLREQLEIIRNVANREVAFLPPISTISWANLRNALSFALAWMGAPAKDCPTVTAPEFGIFPVSMEEVNATLSREPELMFRGKPIRTRT